MKTSLNMHDLTHSIARFFRRFHTILFFLLVSSGLFIAILMLLAVIGVSSTSTKGDNEVIISEFNQSTIDRIKSLGNETPSQPIGRKNPFVE